VLLEIPAQLLKAIIATHIRSPMSGIDCFDGIEFIRIILPDSLAGRLFPLLPLSSRSGIVDHLPSLNLKKKTARWGRS
jgi:hypothetical protein